MADLNELVRQNQGVTQNSKWNQQRRLEFIDFRLFSEGKINRKDLVAFFSISVPQASVDLSRYLELVASSEPPRKNLFYDRNKKYYVKTDDYLPIFTAVCSPDYYLHDLLALTEGRLAQNRNYFGYVPSVGTGCFVPPARNIRSNVLYNILEAIRNERALSITYLSGDTAKNRDYLLAPHALAWDGVRWHVRAYSYDMHGFRDFVLSRITKTSVPEIPAPRDRVPSAESHGHTEVNVSGQNDKHWFELVDLILRPNPELDEGRRRIIELDYGMQDGTTVYTCKRALLRYALAWLRLTEADRALPTERRELVLDNEQEVFRRLHSTT